MFPAKLPQHWFFSPPSSLYSSINRRHRYRRYSPLGNMPSSSSTFVPIPPSIVIDDEDDEDDDFDWEAAIREIDSTCSAVASTSGCENTALLSGKREKPSVGGLRQATLDCFVKKIAKAYDGTSVGGNQADNHPHHDVIYDDSGIHAHNGPHLNHYHTTATAPGQNVAIDLEAAKTWVYPSNVSHRDYQFSITEKALYSNTMVVLPTGLGKTLIAAVVMYNYFRWFPEGKIVFTAPSRPLVMQQIEACHKIVGMPQELTIDMTGNINPRNRIELWKVKRVFFVTPQVLEKDIQTGICLTKKLVCLVIDEAHRASGNYSYCVVLRELIAVSVQLRILALTATPGSKHETVQNVINNLCISTLEYRDENNHDVSKYINDRKSELVKVPMDKGADEIISLLIQIMKPYVNSLNSKRVLPHRDCTIMSPSEWINIKTKFGNEFSINFGSGEKGKIMADIGMMITLSHIRQLLLGYGIRLAYAMLEEKLKGSIARLCRNELIHKARGLMAHHLSHGAPYPKLAKTIALLKDHFESKDSKDSRVMIFSSFRKSVRDIIDSTAQIGGLIKAAEFIGQSSGNKSLKGQSQKTQQAVLQKFRSGEYNVIVSTSIGEEGLDIIEVDLVICFDANISSLRMTQRMGRTGRKNSGRVVVLACEGHELNGYLRKQVNGRAIKKQMLNGGVKSFEFHPSPRMVPHCCKPKLHFVEFSVDKFIHCGRKSKVAPMSRSLLSGKLSTEENDMISKYFHHPNEDNWKPSLIAFPRFQTFPSRIHRVSHSMKTTHMFINAMEHLQMFPSSKANEVLPVEASKRLISECNENHLRGVHDLPDQISYFESSSLNNPNVIYEDHMPEIAAQEAGHQFLFETNFVSVNTLGVVIIASFPTLPFIAASDTSRARSLDHRRRPTCLYETSIIHYNKQNLLPKDALSLSKFSELRCIDSKDVFACQSHIYKQKSKEEAYPKDEIVLQTPLSTQEMLISKDISSQLQMSTISNSILPAYASMSAINHFDLSPKFTLFFEKGVVPESPGKLGHSVSETNHSFSSNINPDHEKCGLHMDHHSINAHISSNLGNETFIEQLNTQEKYDSGYALDETNVQNNDKMSSQINTTSIPINNEVIDGSPDDMLMKYEESLKAVEEAPKFKRLCKYNDIVGKLPLTSFEGNTSETNANSHHNAKVGFHQKRRGLDKKMTLVKSFIEEEAEVSTDADVSEDEEDDKDENLCDFTSSFIDDRSNPSEASAQEENSVDMMAFYRRSLLTQSPLETPSYPISSSHEEITSTSSVKTDPCVADESNNSILTPRAEMHRSAQPTDEYSTKRITSFDIAGEANEAQGDWSAIGSKKRKLAHQCPETGLVAKMQPRDLFQSNSATASSVPAHTLTDLSCDEDFYKNIDLDALEAQATEVLRNKPKFHELPARPVSFPSFDLGL